MPILLLLKGSGTGSVKLPVSGSASVNLSSLTTLSSGSLRFSGIGSNTFVSFRNESSGSQVFRGTGIQSFGSLVPTISGSATTNNSISGAASVSFSLLNTLISGSLRFSGPGTQSLSSLTGLGSGFLIFTGSVNQSFSSLAMISNGKELFYGNATQTFNSLSVISNGRQSFFGQETTVFNSLNSFITASQVFSAVIATTFSSFNSIATSQETFVGVGEAVLGSIKLEAVGNVVSNLGSANIPLNNLDIVGHGTEIFYGNISQSLASVSTNINGKQTFNGNIQQEPLSFTTNGFGKETFSTNINQTFNSIITEIITNQDFIGKNNQSFSSVSSSGIGHHQFLIDGTQIFSPLSIEAIGKQEAVDILANTSISLRSVQLTSFGNQLFNGVEQNQISSLTTIGNGLEIFDGNIIDELGSLQTTINGTQSFLAAASQMLSSLLINVEADVDTNIDGKTSILLNNLIIDGTGKETFGSFGSVSFSSLENNIRGRFTMLPTGVSARAWAEPGHLNKYSIENSEKEKVLIEIPAGAVNTMRMINVIETIPNKTISTSVPKSKIYSFEPATGEQIMFSVPVKITIPANCSSGSKLYTRENNTSPWKEIKNATILPDFSGVSALVEHFSDFIVVDEDSQKKKRNGSSNKTKEIVKEHYINLYLEAFVSKINNKEIEPINKNNAIKVSIKNENKLPLSVCLEKLFVNNNNIEILSKIIKPNIDEVYIEVVNIQLNSR